MRWAGVVEAWGRGLSHDGTFLGLFGIKGLRGRGKGVLTVGMHNF